MAMATWSPRAHAVVIDQPVGEGGRGAEVPVEAEVVVS
jgi:hypothetical protein